MHTVNQDTTHSSLLLQNVLPNPVKHHLRFIAHNTADVQDYLILELTLEVCSSLKRNSPITFRIWTNILGLYLILLTLNLFFAIPIFLGSCVCSNATVSLELVILWSTLFEISERLLRSPYCHKVTRASDRGTLFSAFPSANVLIPTSGYMTLDSFTYDRSYK